MVFEFVSPHDSSTAEMAARQRNRGRDFTVQTHVISILIDLLALWSR